MAKGEVIIKKTAEIQPLVTPKKPKFILHTHGDMIKRNQIGNVLIETCSKVIEKNRKTLLAVGDGKDWDSYEKLIEQKESLSNNLTELEGVSYTNALKGRFPKIKSRNIAILLFFPFDYWDKNIETRDCGEIYGNRGFIKRFRNFWQFFQSKMENAYKGHIIHYINLPSAICLERDKEETKAVLARNGIPIPKSLTTRDAKEIVEILEKGERFYIKVRYGSMGKGISYFEKGRWATNFNFEDGKIVGRKSDYGWKFREITGNLKFLEELLKTDVVVEEAIEPMLINGRRFDIRFYVCMGEVLRIYPRSNDLDAVTTNISQGAKGENQDFLREIPQDSFEAGRGYSFEAAKALKLGLVGVDVIIDREGNPFVLEANSFPGFPRRKDFNLSARIFEKIDGHKFGKD